jgi:hypothetical protein
VDSRAPTTSSGLVRPVKPKSVRSFAMGMVNSTGYILEMFDYVILKSKGVTIK